MNRREAVVAGIATAAAVAFPSPVSAQTAVPDDNPDLSPIRALLDAHDAAFTNHDLSGGSFGFYIPSSDEVNLANFSFYADLVPR